MPKTKFFRYYVRRRCQAFHQTANKVRPHSDLDPDHQLSSRSVGKHVTHIAITGTVQGRHDKISTPRPRINCTSNVY